ncbi:hypothetical protein B296_00010830 [Ensete ventricosum]|uniref:Homeobox domain-containing protein n=1 Tax=Ensete ventricosum TaxID=4639 RepID=A0A427AC45_ENSVE|nr:hypothetical protein B296_00010830 [Ensete ventricosum]
MFSVLIRPGRRWRSKRFLFALLSDGRLGEAGEEAIPLCCSGPLLRGGDVSPAAEEPEEVGGGGSLGVGDRVDWGKIGFLRGSLEGAEMAMVVSGKEMGKAQQAAALAMESGKYVRYTPEQVEALERVYSECPKPSSLKRQQLIRECPILSNIEPKQIKVWFQNRSPYAVPGVRASSGFLGSQMILPLAHTVEHEEDSSTATRTLDLASTLEVGSGATACSVKETASNAYNLRSVLTIAFQFTYENHLRDNVAAMARQYVRSVVASVQRVAMAIAPRPGCQIGGVKHPPGSPEAHTLARWVSRSYR